VIELECAPAVVRDRKAGEYAAVVTGADRGPDRRRNRVRAERPGPMARVTTEHRLRRSRRGGIWLRSNCRLADHSLGDIRVPGEEPSRVEESGDRPPIDHNRQQARAAGPAMNDSEPRGGRNRILGRIPGPADELSPGEAG
jgi:hypothetical protein